jgi:glycerol uptake facilitator-like aquaporin
MLEQAYWVAGIVAAIVAVVGLFLWRKKGTTNINQNAKVSGQGNTVNQRLDSNSSESNGD